jgi:hypothetical protein
MKTTNNCLASGLSDVSEPLLSKHGSLEKESDNSELASVSSMTLPSNKFDLRNQVSIFVSAEF